MLKEALEFLTGQAQKSLDAKFIEVPENERQTLLVTGTGHEFRDNPPPLRRSSVDNTADLVESVLTYCQQKASLWVNEGDVVAILDDEERRECITMPIVLHDHFKELLPMRKPQRMDQADLIAFMRITLHGVIPDDVIGKFRRIDFTRSEAMKSERLRDQESFGKRVETAVQGIDELPDGLVVSVRVFANRDLSVQKKIRLLLDARSSEAVWYVTAVGEDLDNARANALNELAETLRASFEASGEEEKQIKVFAGSP